jgi:hypothetical protein
MTIFYVRRIFDLDADKAKYRCQGVSGTATANTTTNIDWKLPEERWISGGIFMVKDGAWGDTAKFQIVDKDNVLGYGAGVVLDEFATGVLVASDTQVQGHIEAPYIALIPANVYVRIVYTSTSPSVNVGVGINLFTHIPRV